MGKIFEEKSGGFVTCESHSEEKRVDNIVGIAYAMDMLDYVEKDMVKLVIQRYTREAGVRNLERKNVQFQSAKMYTRWQNDFLIQDLQLVLKLKWKSFQWVLTDMKYQMLLGVPQHWL
ncbi:uncharacterized protein LOC131237612 isoform X1 [Magnolia sinica]|uniref:uncharacterized protein LOC131237612 isoform X1 n=1 Tax=Magnolia sinica TaxID=86752 RepID=UPI002658DA04|nr:uncharacterized protein LOC131237612 isoform X1 [Magnolia sinica]